MSRDAWHRLVEPFWLGRALKRAQAVAEAQRGEVTRFALAAIRRERAARALVDDASDAAALALHREAFCDAVRALACAAGEPGAPAETPSACWQRLGELRAAGRVGCELPTLEMAKPALSSDDPLAADALAPREARRTRIATERVLSALIRELEWRSPRAIRRARWQRLVTLGLAASVTLVAVLWLRHFTDNVARFKLPAASGVAAGSPPVAVLTDGDTGRANALHVAPGNSPWASVDLLGRYRLSSVVVHPGVDSTPDMLPLVLELSDDDRHWDLVATRRDPLSEKSPWKVPLGGRPARWVRVRHDGRGSLALSEIEAYAE
jgi:hypothetical protein